MPDNAAVQEQEEQEILGTCEWCSSEIVDDNEGIELYTGPICYSCYANESTTCDFCSDVHHYNDSEECYDCSNYYCNTCVNDHDCESVSEIPGMNDYSYKPYPIFHGNGPLFMGVELECDEGNKNVDPSFIGNLSQYSEGEKLFYLKEDGSLDRGFEVVTHPASLNYHMKKFPWGNIVDVVSGAGYSSHDTDTCGLHVHVSRAGLGRTPSSQELVLSKMVLLFWRFWDQLATFSRRDLSRLREWSKGNHEHSQYYTGNIVHDLDDIKGSNDRYVAINMHTGQETVEFRLFRGTLRRDSIIATLQMLDVLIRLCQDVGITKIYSMNWEEIIERAQVYNELSTYLHIHGLDDEFLRTRNVESGQVGPYYSGAISK